MPRNNHLPHFSAKTIFTLLGVLALLLIIYFNHHLLIQCWHLLGQIYWYLILVVVAVQLLSYLLNALYYRSILRVFNYEVALKKLYEGALATNYVMLVVPSAGAAGAGYLSQVLSPGVSRGESVLTQIMRSVLDALAILLLMPIGIILIILSSRANKGLVIKESLISTAIVLAVSFMLFWLVQHEVKFKKVVGKIILAIRKIYPGFGGEKPIKNFFNSFYRGFNTMFCNKKRMLVPFAWSILYVTVELLTVYIVFLAFGKIINPGVVIIGYLIANIVSIFGGVLFSVGAFELGMAGTFIALGVSSSLAVSITVVYRSLNILISLPPGFFYYRKFLP